MPSPSAIARAGNIFQPVGKAGKKAAKVQDAAGNAIEGLTAKPWSADGKHWELSNGNIVDSNGTLVLLRDKGKWLSPDGTVVSQDLVDLTRAGDLDPVAGVPNLDELAPVSQIDIGELDPEAAITSTPNPRYNDQLDKLGLGNMRLPPAMRRTAEELLNEANNIGGDILSGGLEGISRDQVAAFRKKFLSAPPRIQDFLLEKDPVTAARVQASLVGQDPSSLTKLPSDGSIDAATALSLVDDARKAGDGKEYIRALQRFQSFPVDEQDVAKAAREANAEYNPQKISAGEFQERPRDVSEDELFSNENAEAKEAALARETGRSWREERRQRLRDKGKTLATSEGEQKLRELRQELKDLQEKGASRKEIKAKSDAVKQQDKDLNTAAGRGFGLLEKVKLEKRTQAQRQQEKVGKLTKQLDKLRKDIATAQENGQYDVVRKLQDNYENLSIKAENAVLGYERMPESQLRTAQGMISTAVGNKGPLGDRITRATATLSPREILEDAEAAAARGEFVDIRDLPEVRKERVSLDDIIHGDEDTASAALGQQGGGKVRGRPSPAKQADAIRQLLARKRTALVPKDRPPENVIDVRSQPLDPANARKVTVSVDPTVEEIFGPREADALAKDISELSLRAMDLSPQYGTNMSQLARRMARDDFERALEAVYGLNPQSRRPLAAAEMADVPAAPTSQASSPVRGESNPEGIPGLIARRNRVRGVEGPSASPATKETLAEATRAVEDEVNSLTPEQVRAEMTRLNNPEPAPESPVPQQAASSSTADDLSEVSGSLDEAVPGEDLKPSNARELDEVQGNLDASATPVEEKQPAKRRRRSGKASQSTPQDAELAPVSGTLDEQLADLEAQRAMAEEDMYIAESVDDQDAYAEAESRARKIRNEIDRVTAEAAGESTPSAAAETTAGETAAAPEPAPAKKGGRRGGGRKATPKQEAPAASTPDELSDVTGNLEASSTPIDDPADAPAPAEAPKPSQQTTTPGRTSGFTAMDDEGGVPQPPPEAQPPRRQFAEYDDEGNLVSSPDPVEERPRTNGIDDDGNPQRVRDEAEEPVTKRNPADEAGDETIDGRSDPGNKDQRPWWMRKRYGLVGLGAAGYAINELANQPPRKPTMEEIMDAKRGDGYMTSEERARMILDRLKGGEPVRRPYQTGHTPIGRRGF